MIEKVTQGIQNQGSSQGDRKEWEWMPCVYDFKQEYDGKVIIWNFSPYVMLSADDFNVIFPQETKKIILLESWRDPQTLFVVCNWFRPQTSSWASA